jgi:hypothetical protein
MPPVKYILQKLRLASSLSSDVNIYFTTNNRPESPTTEMLWRVSNSPQVNVTCHILGVITIDKGADSKPNEL